MLAVAAGLLVQTMRAVSALPLGFDPANVISVGLAVDFRTIESAAARARFESELVAAVRATPGVVAAGIGSRPLGGGGGSNVFRRPEDIVDSRISVDVVGPGYLEAVGARLVAGRFLESHDDAAAPKAAVVNEAAARQYFPDGAVGRTLLQEGEAIRIVGVLADVRRGPLEEEPRPEVYLPSGQTRWFSTNNMLIRTAGDPREMLPAIRTVVRNIHPELPLTARPDPGGAAERGDGAAPVHALPRRTLLDHRAGPGGRRHLWRDHGVSGAAHTGDRRPDGARRYERRRDCDGAAAGRLADRHRSGTWTAAAWALNGAMAAFVFRVRTTDPLAFALACGVLVTAGLLACVIPARRAARVDPVIALRAE
jgi:putative ABC transport system permease protein